MTCDTRTRVMLADDHQVMRDLLQDALENTGEFQAVAQAADGEEAVRMVEEAVPEVICMDLVMLGMEGIEAWRVIKERLPGIRVLMLTTSSETDAIVRSIGAGATGFLQKHAGKGQLPRHPAGGGRGRVPHPGERGPALVPGGARRLVREST